ncbi:hypothetical protein GGS26DRAFT_110147 [Hypomontagnella submonticulosa]|nr:hypothetical protein GGS26DRAFT_110147 [Hypomontagnella submonticulosa]
MLWYIQGVSGVKDHVPKLHKILRDEATGYLILIMDYIEGHDLVEVWRHGSREDRRNLAESIARVVALMRTTTARYPGPVGMSRQQVLVHKHRPIPLKVDGPEYTRYLNSLIDEVNCHRPPKRQLSHVKFSQFVLANMQLDPSSFIVENINSIWIVGWGKGGFFPTECELAMAERLMPIRFDPIMALLTHESECDEHEKEAIEAVAEWIDGTQVDGRTEEDSNHEVRETIEL